MSLPKVRNFHVPLAANLYTELHRQAALAGLPATALAREALDDWLRQRKRERLQSELQAYVTATAGTHEDLDDELAHTSAELFAEGGRR
jgi:hypothetical protein